jgi:plasmid maintenance system antidote protein VapI
MADGLSARHWLIGRMLGELLQAAGLELADLADAAGCDRSKVSRIVDGIRGVISVELSSKFDDGRIGTRSPVYS